MVESIERLGARASLPCLVSDAVLVRTARAKFLLWVSAAVCAALSWVCRHLCFSEHGGVDGKISEKTIVMHSLFKHTRAQNKGMMVIVVLRSKISRKPLPPTSLRASFPCFQLSKTNLPLPPHAQNPSPKSFVQFIYS